MQVSYLLRNRYLIEKPLSAGGFGKTYIATDEDFPGKPRKVVKHLKPQNSSAKVLEIARRLFETEAKTLANLGTKTDRIPTLYAYFEENQEFYLVQEFIEGKTLTQELENRRLSEAETLEVLQEILTGLETVHSNHVIHRDLKPDNIIRRANSNELVLIDFGAVKAIRQATNLQISQTISIGTPGYMPSEQGIGNPKLASDVYAAGAIALQCLTGVHPFDLLDPDTSEFKWRHLCQVSDRVANVLYKMVAVSQANRYPNANEAKKALDLLITPVSPPSVHLKPTAQPVIPQPSPFNNSPSTTKINRPVKTAAPPIPVIINNPTPAKPIKSPIQSVTPTYNNHTKWIIIAWAICAGIVGIVFLSVTLSQLFKGADRNSPESITSSSPSPEITSNQTSLSFEEKIKLTPVKIALVIANVAIKSGDPIKAKLQFDKFNAIWPEAEPILKAKGGHNYPAIMMNIEMVKTAMNGDPFDKSKAGEGLTNTIKILSHIMNEQYGVNRSFTGWRIDRP
jgi:serine/threonine protein kinase